MFEGYAPHDASISQSRNTQYTITVPVADPGLYDVERKLEKLRVAELKNVLRALGMKVSGRKADLVQRICRHYEVSDRD